MTDRYEVQWRQTKDDKWEPQVDFPSRWLANNYIESQAPGGTYRIVVIPMTGEGNDRTSIGNTPTCVLCGGTLTDDLQGNPNPIFCHECADGYVGVAHRETIDITPRGCQTPEGNARVNQVLQRIDQTSRRVADAAQRYVKAFDAESQTSELDELRAAIQERQSAYTEFLRAVAGR